MKLKTLVLAFGLAMSMNAKCQRSDAGPVLQVALDVDCAIHWIGHTSYWLGRGVAYPTVVVVGAEIAHGAKAVKKFVLRAYRGLD